ncbi:MAG: hypothetical protein WDZ48_07105 [Pirellulales bacterium]
MRAVKKKATRATLLGIGFDAEDGHTRLSRGDNFVLCGGSEETHAVMQETATKINEHLDRRGQRLDDVTVGQLRDICESIRR